MTFIVMFIPGIILTVLAWIASKLSEFFEPETRPEPIRNHQLPEDKVKKFENDYRFSKQEVGRCKKQFQILSQMIKNTKETRTDSKNVYQEVILKKDSKCQLDCPKTKSQSSQENNDSKKALVSLPENFNRKTKAHEQFNLARSVPIANNLAADERATENDLSALQSRIQMLEEEKVLQREKTLKWEATESQLREEIVDLKKVVGKQKQGLATKKAEMYYLAHENELLLQNLDSVTTHIAIHLNKLNNLDPELLTNYCATSFLATENEELKQEAMAWRKKFEALQIENRKMWEMRDDTLRSWQKAKKLADEQLAALAESLTALQQAILDAKKEATEIKVGDMGDRLIPYPSYERGQWYDRWVQKKTRILPAPSREELQFINLLYRIGSQINERATVLKEHAKHLKKKGNDLKKRAKILSQS